ncbi:methyl-accepting chemotaxis protein [Vibrio fluvialis]|nr:methyl-accepting chemotaxis protein [Vibrio fluvialis]
MAATENKDYPENISFISTTQPSSHITYANEAFCDVAEYELDEMLAQPHNMVRHPEMPKAAFEQLWQYLNQGKSWMGIVKNRCKGPRHYWVSAFVTPIKDAQGNIVEHQSVRSKPSKEQVARAEAVSSMQRGSELSLQCKQTADSTGGVIQDIAAKLGQVTHESQQIAAAVEQQASATREITANAVNIKTLTEKNSLAASSSVQRTQHLVHNLEQLQRLIHQFERH